MGNSQPVLEVRAIQADSPSLWRSVVGAYRCYFLFSFVIIYLEALENHYRLITTIVMVCEVSSGCVIWDVHWWLIVH